MQLSIPRQLTNLPPIVFVALAISLVGFWQAYYAEVKCTEIEQHKAEIQEQRAVLAHNSTQVQVITAYAKSDRYSESEALNRRKQEINSLAKYSSKRYNKANANVQNENDSFIETDKKQFSSHALDLELD